MEAKLNAALRVLIATAEDSLLHGQHDGPCDNDPEIWESGPCEQHLAASSRRYEALKKAVANAKREWEAEYGS